MAMMKDELYGQDGYDAIWYLINCGFVIRLNGTYILIDPILSLPDRELQATHGGYQTPEQLPVELRHYSVGEVYGQRDEVPLAASDVQQADIVLISHDHGDHLNKDSIRGIAHLQPTVIAPKYCHEQLAELNVAPGSLREAEYGSVFDFDGISINVTYAKHHTPGDCGFLIKSTHGTIYYPGDHKFDTPHKEEMCNLSVDYLLLPINDTNMGVGFAALLTQILQPRVVIPCHFGYFSPPIRSQGAHPAEYLTTIAARRYRLPNTDIMILSPGGKVVLT